jgi:RNA polymerase sigma-70 factor (ECF subfamily)
MFREHVAFVSRAVRRMGVDPSELEDATQEVFVVASRKVDQIEPGTEKAFLFGTAMRVASNVRRTKKRSKLTLGLDLSAHPARAERTAEETLDRQRAREMLDAVLDTMDDDTRAVFTLRELEGMTVPEIARLLSIPPGTVASRLRRGHAQFDEALTKLQESRRR